MPTLNSLTFTLADGAWETSQTPGTGSYTLDGAKVSSGITYRTFLAALGNGVRTLYVARMGTGWEVALGTISSPGTLSRDSIIGSSNSNNAVSWAAGIKDIQVDISAALANQIFAQPTLPEHRAAIATTSGVSHAFSSISALARRLTVKLNGVSTNGTSSLILLLGDSGGLETTGYAGTISRLGASSLATAAQPTTAFVIADNVAASVLYTGVVRLELIGSNIWMISGHMSTNGAEMHVFAGSKQLSATLDRIQLGTAAGNTFDAGLFGLTIE